MLNPPAVGKELKFFQYVDGNNFVFWSCLLDWFLAALDIIYQQSQHRTKWLHNHVAPQGTQCLVVENRMRAFVQNLRLPNNYVLRLLLCAALVGTVQPNTRSVVIKHPFV